MLLDPATIDISGLFQDPQMFDSGDGWREAGFQVVRDVDRRIIVASHTSAPGLLFKRYRTQSRSPQDQLRNFNCRIKGAGMLREHIRARNLSHIVVPQKWICALPPQFGPNSCVLVVERLDLADGETTRRSYDQIHRSVLMELCGVLFAFRGLDFTVANASFTRGGQIAFVDTEHVARNTMSRPRRRRKFLRSVGRVLSGDRLALAEQLWAELEVIERAGVVEAGSPT
jgi:hypothetical protein